MRAIRTMKKSGVAVAILCVLALAAPGVWADDSPAGEVEVPADSAAVVVAVPADGEAEEESRADALRDPVIDEITVTSRRREENQQKIPMSITAFSQEDLDEIDAVNASDIANLTPNLVLNPTASGSSAFVTCMRGLCRTDTTLTDDPYVGIYFNGIYTGKAMGSVFDVADLERIEIQRGPQGTLFGKNTLGGSVNLVSAKPSGEAGARFSFLGGSYTTLNWKGVVDLPEVWGFSNKLAFTSRKHDHFTKNENPIFPGSDLGNEDRQAILYDLLWEPVDAFWGQFTFDWSQQNQDPLANFSTQNGGIYAPPPITTPPTPTFDERNDFTWSYQEPGKNVKNDANSQGYGLTLHWDIGDFWAIEDSYLKSLTSHRRYDNQYNVNASGLSWRNLWTEDDFDYNHTSQELQFAGTAFDDRLSILMGFYYLNEQGEYQNAQGFMAAPDPGPPLVIVGGTFFNALFDTDITYNSYAFYTEEVFTIIENLDLTAGVRYTYEDREGGHSYATSNPDGFVPGAGNGPLISWSTDDGVDFLGNPTDTDFTSSTWSPRVYLSYQALPELMVFTGWSRGFKSGGFNARSATANTWNPYDDEKVDSLEAGFKSTFWGNRAILNITGFYQWVSDKQVQFNRVAPSGVFEVLLDNAGDARIYGCEVESTVRPVEGLELRAGFGLTDSHYIDLINPFNGEDESDLRHIEFSPKYNWNVTARYVFPPTPVGDVYIRADYSGTSNYGFNTLKADDYNVGQEPYNLLNLRLALSEVPLGRAENGNLELAFVANNVTEANIRVGGYGTGADSVDRWFTNVYTTAPRFFGGEVIYRWGSQE